MGTTCSQGLQRDLPTTIRSGNGIGAFSPKAYLNFGVGTASAPDVHGLVSLNHHVAAENFRQLDLRVCQSAGQEYDAGQKNRLVDGQSWQSQLSRNGRLGRSRGHTLKQ